MDRLTKTIEFGISMVKHQGHFILHSSRKFKKLKYYEIISGKKFR